MESSPATACVNHPWVDTGTACERCRQPFCESCLVELLGGRYCGPCRDFKLAEVQGQTPTAAVPLAGTGVVDLRGWLEGGWLIIQQDLMTFALASLVAILLWGVTCGICLGPLSAGLLMMCYRKMTYGRTEFGDLWEGFQRFGWSFVLTLGVMALSGLFVTALIVPYYVAVFNIGANTGAIAMMEMAYTLSSTVVSAGLRGVTFFALPHVAARNANPIEALSVSWAIFRRNPLMFCVAGLIFELISSLGAVFCCVGVLVTYPLVIAATARAYADHVGIEGWDKDLVQR